MARNILVTSDTHFGHENIIRYCNRPFDSVHQMNEVLIDNWNKTISEQDIIYHLGDVYFKDQTVLPRLNGHKRLVLGNHDNGKDQHLIKYFEKIMVWRMFPEFGLLLTHVPVHESTLQEKCPCNIHGHIHQNDSPSKNHINVSVEKTDYKPINIEDLRVK